MRSFRIYDHIVTATVAIIAVAIAGLSQKNGPGKNGQAGSILVTTSGPVWPKMVQCHEPSMH